MCKMNERIKQFSELSKSYKTILVDGQMQSVLLIDPERFAEMIVRECAELVRIQNEQFMTNESHYGVVSTDILKHFGVKHD